MRILCICEHGNNRSTNLATRLRYEYYAETIPIGTKRVSNKTMRMLCEWADYIIVVEARLVTDVLSEYKEKLQVWEIGPDTYPRPYNAELDAIVRKLVQANPLE